MEMLKSVLDTLELLAVVLDTEGNIVFCNKYLARLTGWERREISGKNWFDLFIPEEISAEIRKEVFERTLDTGEFPAQYDNPILTRGGEERMVRWNNTLFRNAHGEIAGIISIGEDVTARLKDEKENREHLAFLNSIMDHTPVAMWISDASGTVLRANRALYDALQLSAEQVVGKYNVLKDENLVRQGVMEQTEAVFRDMTPARFTIPWKAAEAGEVDFDGTPDLWIDVSLFPIQDAGGNLSSVVCQWVDITDRVQTEQALRESERRMNTLLGNLPGMAFRGLNEPDWPFEFLSEGCFGLTGYSQREFEQHTVKYGELVHKDDRQYLWDIVQSALHRREAYQAEYRIVTRTGEEKWVWEQGRAVTPKGEERAVLEGLIIDITERKQAEAQLLESKRLLDATGRMARVGGWELDADTLEVRWTEETYRIHEISPGDKLHLEDAVEYFHPEDREILSKAVRRALDQGEMFDLELRLVTAGGKKLWVRIICRPVIERGRTVRLAGTFQDVTERKKVGQALLASEERFRTLVENLSDMVFVHDLEGRITLVNRKACENTGYTEEELLSLNVADIDPGVIDREDRGKFWLQLKEYEVAEVEGFHRRKNGSEYPVQVHMNRMKIGGIPVVIAVARDMTERKRAEEEKKKLEEKFYQAQKLESVGRLAGGVAHDLNNLLTPVLGYGEMLIEDDQLHSMQRESVEEILQAGRRARDLVRQLLAFSRKQTLELKLVDLNQLVKRFEKLLRRTIRENIDIRVRLSAGLPRIMGDNGQLEQVIMNLAVNAQDAMEHGGDLVIETKCVNPPEESFQENADPFPHALVMLSVGDTGCGMNADTQEHIFEPFFTTKGVDEGTGLGLATVYGIVKQHGGVIQVESEPGAGTRIKIFLPAAAECVESPVCTAEAVRAQGGSETILLVEDNEEVRNLTCRILRSRGYTVLAASRGNEALDLLHRYEGAVDLLLTDVVMPDMNGVQLYESVSAAFPDIKVLFMSGYPDTVVQTHGAALEGFHFIQKPYTVGFLDTTLREILGS